MHSRRTAFAFFTSSIPETMGKRILKGPYALALKMPRSWALKSSTSLMQRRMARRPMAGLISFGTSILEANLSPPISRVRIVVYLTALFSASFR